MSRITETIEITIQAKVGKSSHIFQPIAPLVEKIRIPVLKYSKIVPLLESI